MAGAAVEGSLMAGATVAVASQAAGPRPAGRIHALVRAGRAAGPALLVLLLAVPALQPVWQPGLQQTDDGMHHLFRFFNLDLALRAGHPGARWLAGEGFGYGFPVLNFYAPLGYYFGLPFHLLGAGFVTTLELTLAAGLLLAALAMYAFARELLGRWGGALAAVAYTFAPYHLADAWTRGALAELLAFIWLPLLLLAMLRCARAEGRGALWPALWGGLCFAGLIATHNLTAILAAPVLAAWGLRLLFAGAGSVETRRRRLGAFALMGLLGLALSAAFWLPALAEAQYVRAGQIAAANAGWAGSLQPLRSLIAPGWDYRYTALQSWGIDHPLGQAQTALAVAGVATAVWHRHRLSPLARRSLPVFVGLALFALFMQSRWSIMVWRLPGLLLLQFPWRWQTVAALASAVLSGYAAILLATRSPEGTRVAGLSGLRETRFLGQALVGSGLVVLVAAVLMSGALPNLPWKAANFPTSNTPASDANVDAANMALYDYGRGLWLREHGSDWMFEYMPVWVQTPRSDFFLSAGPAPASEPPLSVRVTPARQAPLERRFRVAAAGPWTLQLHQFYFPGWQALIDGQVRPAAPSGPLGLAAVVIPAGEHEVAFRFGSTAMRRAGWGLSLTGLALVLAGVIWLRRRRWLLAAGIIGILFVGLVLRARAANPADYTPTPVQANFGSEAQLIGFHAPAAQLRPDKPATVTLDWLALRRPTADYKVFVHLVDMRGKLWAQSDGEPGFFFSPTTRWQSGEMVEDVHVLVWQGTPPAGHYQLRAGLYNPASGARLPVLDAGEATSVDQLLLAEFDIP